MPLPNNLVALATTSAAAGEAKQRATAADAQRARLREVAAETDAAVAWCLEASGGSLVVSAENTPLLLVLHALRRAVKVGGARE